MCVEQGGAARERFAQVFISPVQLLRQPGLVCLPEKLGLCEGLKLPLRGCPPHMFTPRGVEEFTRQAGSRF